MENIQIKISETPMDVDYEYGPPRASTRYVSGHPEFVEIVNIRIGGQDIAWHSLFSDGAIDKIEEVILAIRRFDIADLRAG